MLMLLQMLMLMHILIGTFSNDDGNAKDNNSEKSHSRLTFYFFVRFNGDLFSPP